MIVLFPGARKGIRNMSAPGKRERELDSFRTAATDVSFEKCLAATRKETSS